jgi:aryl-alcohol dehydrogenase-like predicted oxidoreductase
VVTDPWIPARQGGTTDIVLKRHGQPTEIIPVTTDEWLYGREADTAVEFIAARQASSPAMSWADSLGNAQTLDQWRKAVGLVYDREKPAAPEMTRTVSRRPLVSGRTGHGLMRYGSIKGVNKPMSRLILGVDNQPNISYASVMFDDFYERGGNVFDTAFIYMGGMAEGLLGQWVRNRGIREQVVILDKGAHTPFCTPADLTKQFEISLERLQTDYVDLYCMHRDNPDIPAGEFIDVLNEQWRAGRIKVFGGSNWTAERVEEANAYAARTGQQGFSVLSNNFSLARMIEPPWAGCMSASTVEFRAWLTANQMPLLPWSSQARGFFLPHVTPDYAGDPEVVRCWFADDNFERKQRAVALAEKHGVQPINIALAYVLFQPFPTFPLIGPRTLEETRSSLQALSVTLSEEEVRWLNLEV